MTEAEIVDRIAKRRRELGWTIERAATEAGWSRPYWSRLESGAQPPRTMAVLARMAKTVGFSLQFSLIDARKRR